MIKRVIIIAVLIFTCNSTPQDSLNTRLLGHLDTPGLAQGIDVAGEYAYIADYDIGGLRIINISDLGTPAEVSYIDTIGWVQDVKIYTNYAFIVTLNAGLSPGLKVIDISNPLMPELVGYLQTPNSAQGLVIRGNYAYIAYGGGLLIANISNPNNPVEVSTLNLNADARDIELKDNYAFVATLLNGLKIIDISNPYNPYEVSTLNIAAYAQGLDIHNDYLYVAAVVLQIIDVADPLNPQIVGSLNIPNSPNDVSVQNDFDYAYVVADGRGLRVIDVADKSNPYEIGYYTPAGALGVVAQGNISFIAGGDQGLFIVQSLPTLIQPNGGENWQVSTTQQITWQGIDTVKIDYSTDDGLSWQLVVNNYPANSGNYNWLIPNTPSSTCRVKISDVQFPATNDISDNIFTIYLPTITVTVPNGGENWIVGSMHNINWTSTNVTNVKIEYTTNNGTNWTTITASTPSDGSYNWTIPNTQSNNCRVKITDVTNSSIFDESDNDFSIYQLTINVSTPNGGEIWQIGTVQNITWTSTNVTNVKIDYSTNNGNNWIQIISTVPASNQTYAWTIPNTVSTNCKVRISDVSNPSYYDISDNVFSILPYPSITVIAPNGGETFEGTYIENITYNSIAVDSVMIEYSTNAGVSWVLVYSSKPANGNVTWIVPNITSESCLIKVTDIEDANNFDISDNEFVITEVGWYQQNSNIGDNLYSIDMWNSSLGYACGGNGTIIKTTDGGQIWESLTTGIVEDLHSIKFVTENTGWVVGDNGRILRTTNGGLSWSYQTSNTTNPLYSIYIINQNIGWAAGLNGIILKTTDTGNSWVTQQSNVAANIKSIFFISPSLGWAVGNEGTYLKTTNGGETWVQKTTGTNYNLNAIFFTSNERGFIVGNSGTILRTEDAGEVWTNVSTSTVTFYSIAYANAETGYIVGTGGQIYKTTDIGINWFRIGSGLQSGDDLFDINFKDLNTGWAVGENGKIIKTTTGGTGYATTTLIANATASSQILEVANIEGFFVDNNIVINPGGINEENNKIVGFGSFLLETPLLFDHQVGEVVISLNPSLVEGKIEELPKEYSLLNNYPNPFNPSTKIRYTVPQFSQVIIKIYDVLGNEIETLVNEQKEAGNYEYTWYVENLPSGVYLYRLQAGSFIETKKMVFMK